MLGWLPPLLPSSKHKEEFTFWTGEIMQECVADKVMFCVNISMQVRRVEKKHLPESSMDSSEE